MHATKNLGFQIVISLFGTDVQPETFVVEQIASAGVKVSPGDRSVLVDWGPMVG
ncbi:hypothetical protein [Microbulbifer sp. TRSA007]|uniref:hypothetical protein n=1 Tax=Microbulbifer sp. TRSA007 TaxID=3243384 RepID=UPI00403A060B